MSGPRGRALALAALLVPATGTAQSPPIEDNSFLVEEAYNQNPDVIQHISNFTRLTGGAWLYTFTQEWPLGGMRNQGSYTLPLTHPAAGGVGPGDIALNYRYQLVGSLDPADRVFVAPRLTMFLPTGSWRAGRGTGSWGWQLAVPVSLQPSRFLAVHLNAGATVLPWARDPAGDRARLWGINLGGSAVWYVRPEVNLLVEAVWQRLEAVTGPGSTQWEATLLLNPGVRWAWNFRSGLQIVPGVAWTIGLGPSAGTDGPFLYLSFEHPLHRLHPG